MRRERIEEQDSVNWIVDGSKSKCENANLLQGMEKMDSKKRVILFKKVNDFSIKRKRKEF